MKFSIPPLESYLSDIDDNMKDHKIKPPDVMYLINDMDVFFREEVFIDALDLNPFSALLSLHGSMQLNASISQALSGHVVTVFPIVRSALEAACYAFIISRDENNGIIWQQRHDSKEQLKKCRAVFNVANAVKYLKKISEEMGQYVDDLYISAIDFGAHPNPKAIMNHLEYNPQPDDGQIHFSLNGVYGVNS